MTLRGSRPRPGLPHAARWSRFNMAAAQQPRKSRSMWLFALICIPLVLSLIDCARDLYCDTTMIRSVALHSEMGQLRSEAIRRAGRLEALLEVNAAQGDGSSEIGSLSPDDQPWLYSKWAALSEPISHESYSALVDPQGMVVLHSNPAAVGKRLTSEWDDQKEPAAGNDVVRINAGPFVGETPAFDVNVPLYAGGRWIGQLHSGLDASWFDREVAAQQRKLLWQRSWIVALVLAANLGAVIGLVLLARDFGELRRKLVHEIQYRTRQLSQIGMGLAHEIRNPLQALRINVHTLRRSVGRAQLDEQQMTDMMRESDDEIDHLDGLMRDFVQYTVPHTGDRADVDLRREVQATLGLVSEELRRKQIELKTQFVDRPLTVHIDPARLRQVALHLLTFAQRSAGVKGTVQVSIAENNGAAELVIADTGPALSDADQARLFEPFQSTAHSDAGLGLALIRRFVEEAGGSIDRRKQSDMSGFRVLLPLAKHNSQGT